MGYKKYLAGAVLGAFFTASVGTGFAYAQTLSAEAAELAALQSTENEFVPLAPPPRDDRRGPAPRGVKPRPKPGPRHVAPRPAPRPKPGPRHVAPRPAPRPHPGPGYRPAPPPRPHPRPGYRPAPPPRPHPGPRHKGGFWRDLRDGIADGIADGIREGLR